MKKYYFMVLIALLAFSLNAKAQDATGQDETNNRMTVKMNDGTSFILNTDNVAEITFGDGVPAFSAQNIAKALAALDELGQYVNRLKALERSHAELLSYVTALQAQADVTLGRTTENRDLIAQVQNETANLKMISTTLEGRLANIEALISSLADADLITRSANQEAAINSLQAYMVQLATEIQNLKAQVASMQQ